MPIALTYLIAYIILLMCAIVCVVRRHGTKKVVPLSVNYHFTRRCNKECGFCFHTAKTSFILSEPAAKRGLSLLKRAGMRKLNFAGGEPFLYPKFLGSLVQYGKEVLDIESISIVTNGSLVREDWLRRYGSYLDIMAVSCDSFNEDANIRIGRGSGDNVAQLFKLRDWCRQYGIKFKLNTVVCRDNVDENMSARVAELEPFRWKCFQVLKVEGENDSDKTLRDVRRFEISDDEFAAFCGKHRHLKCFVPESNRVMAHSYLLLDEYMRFLRGDNKNTTSKTILDIGIERALEAVYWDKESFQERGGVYDWTRHQLDTSDCGRECGGEKNLEW
ncbi:Radical S-adenosyl methionine-containing protein 2 [Hirsutella minnesotensis 3608]|uniref:Radical S-adenosyl methionine-containing protein 2 n=1 Tax=Hirsutella minnesotensis 3608 TaxID=1043627 RepID=A0A0F8A5G1_9HYPO|nr:Radical S-adenosyl methionine-containing protein 2 [Hirsutella minnesotensis 3608]